MRQMIVLELNEAEEYFIQHFIQFGYLPHFKKLYEQGKYIKTELTSWAPFGEANFRHITPWLIWPSIYTGITPDKHELGAFGQDASILSGKTLWEALDKKGVSSGIFNVPIHYSINIENKLDPPLNRISSMGNCSDTLKTEKRWFFRISSSPRKRGSRKNSLKTMDSAAACPHESADGNDGNWTVTSIDTSNINNANNKLSEANDLNAINKANKMDKVNNMNKVTTLDKVNKLNSNILFYLSETFPGDIQNISNTNNMHHAHDNINSTKNTVGDQQSYKKFVIPSQFQFIQNLLNLTSQSYQKNNLGFLLTLFIQLIRSLFYEIPFYMVWQFSKNIVTEIIGHKKTYPFILLHAELQFFIFEKLFNRYQPQFTICHLNFLAELQLKFWRAFEPEGFSKELGEVDKCFYESKEVREQHEVKYKNAILEGFMIADKWVGRLMNVVDTKRDQQTYSALVVMNGLGQKKHDPAMDPNPTLYFHNINKLMHFVDITDYVLLDERRADLTLNFKNEDEAKLAAYKFSEIKLLAKKPFFKIKQKQHQLFLEADLTPEIWSVGNAAWLENEATGKNIRLFDFVYFNRNIDQETSKRSATGWMIFYGDMHKIDDYTTTTYPTTEPPTNDYPVLEITKIKNFLLNWYFSRDKKQGARSKGIGDR